MFVYVCVCVGGGGGWGIGTQFSPLYPCMCKYAFAGLANFNLISESILLLKQYSTF